MKKTKLVMMVIAMVAISSSLFAQLPDGSYAKDISMKKLSSDGTVITDTVCTIYQYTDAGKPVIMDVSAIWCAPCWAYHTSGALEGLYNSYGPGATNEVMVYFVEGDGGTIAELNGGTGSQGNWVSGTPYPILPTIAPNTNQINTDYAIAYFPTVYLICPNRVVTEIGQVATAALIAGARACPVLTSNALDASIFKVTAPGTTIYCGNMSPKLTIQNYGTTTITAATIKLLVDGVEASSYDWTGSIARLETADITMPAYSNAALSNGTHAVKLVVEAPNGGTDLNLTDNEKVISVNNVSVFGAYPVAESFAASTFPPTSWSKDDGTDGTGWARSTAHSGCAKIDFFNISGGAIDYLMLPPVDMTSATSMGMTFKVAYAQYSASYSDRLQVEVSSDCGATWVSKYNKAGSTLSTSAIATAAFTPSAETQWRQELVDLSSYAGEAKVMIRFKATSAYGNNCYVDEINLSTTADVNANDLFSGMNLFPNPSNSNTNLEFYAQKQNTVSVVVVNTIGEVVFSNNVDATQGFNTIQIPSEKFNSGIYFVTIKGQNSNATQKLVIQK